MAQQPQPTAITIKINDTLQIVPGNRKTATQAIVRSGDRVLRVSID